MASKGGDEVLKEIMDRRGHVSDNQRFLAKHAPTLLVAYEELYDKTLADDSDLPIRYREYIAIGILLTRGASEGGIVRHMSRALEHGSSTSELLSAIQAMLLPGGAPVFNRGVSLLRKLVDAGGTGEKADSTGT